MSLRERAEAKDGSIVVYRKPSKKAVEKLASSKPTGEVEKSERTGSIDRRLQ